MAENMHGTLRVEKIIFIFNSEKYVTVMFVFVQRRTEFYFSKITTYISEMRKMFE